LEGFIGQHLGKIKVKAWKGPNYIIDPDNDEAGVDWILAENWWPYQRPSFVTPPFAGYISGHSTYSRAAAELMTLLTGDEYFPGGMGEFLAPQNEFLVFEDGPSMDITLQWATYRDASDQCSLSRIWGGIHPPADDIPGRLIGAVLGVEAFEFAEDCIDANGRPDALWVTANIDTITDANAGSNTFTLTVVYTENMDTLLAPVFSFPTEDPLANTLTYSLVSSDWLNLYTYQATYDVGNSSEVVENIDVRVEGCQNEEGVLQAVFDVADLFSIETQNPTISNITTNINTIADADMGSGTFYINVTFDEAMDMGFDPAISFPTEDPMANTLTMNSGASGWVDATNYMASYDVADADETLANIDVQVNDARDLVGNPQVQLDAADVFNIDTENPTVMSVSPSIDYVYDGNLGTAGFDLTVVFSESMESMVAPILSFPSEDPTANSMVQNVPQSGWIDAVTYLASYAVIDGQETLDDIDVSVGDAADAIGNRQIDYESADNFNIDTENPIVVYVTANLDTIKLANVGSGEFNLTFEFSEAMDGGTAPDVAFPVENPMNTLTWNSGMSEWTNGTTYDAWYDVMNAGEVLTDIDLSFGVCIDLPGNTQLPYSSADVFSISMDTMVGIDPIVGGSELPAIRIYPNPVTPGNVINVEIDFIGDEANLEMTNIHGQQVYFQNLPNLLTSSRIQIPVNDLAAGLYFIRVAGDDSYVSAKVEVLR
jgi:hypothetical protein